MSLRRPGAPASQPVEVVLVLLAPLLLVALGRLELLLLSLPVGVRFDEGALADGASPAGDYESGEQERKGDGDEDDDREHGVTLPVEPSGQPVPVRSAR